MAVTAYAGALTVLADVKARLTIPNLAQDDFLQTLINGASRKIESHTHRALKERTYTGVLFNGSGQQFFDGDPLLDRAGWSLASGESLSQLAFGRRLEVPLNSVTSIALDDTAQTIGNDPDLFDVQLLTLGRPSGLGDGFYRAGGWTRGLNNLLTTYKGGFATIPEDLAEGCILTVMAWFLDKDRGYIRLTSFSAQGESIQLEKTAIPTVAKEMIEQFVRPVVVGI